MFGLRAPCPRCHGHTFRPSRSGWLRYVALPIFLRPFRCTHCHGRVWRFSLRSGYDRARRSGEVPTIKKPPPRPPAAAAA